MIRREEKRDEQVHDRKEERIEVRLSFLYEVTPKRAECAARRDS